MKTPTPRRMRCIVPGHLYNVEHDWTPKCETFGCLPVLAPVPPIERRLHVELECAAKGCVSGTLAEWPQLKEALKKVYESDIPLNTPAHVLKNLARQAMERLGPVPPGYIGPVCGICARPANSCECERVEAEATVVAPATHGSRSFEAGLLRDELDKERQRADRFLCRCCGCPSCKAFLKETK